MDSRPQSIRRELDVKLFCSRPSGLSITWSLRAPSASSCEVIEGRAPICTAVFGRTRPTARRSLFGGSFGLLRSLRVTADRVRRPGIRTQISDTWARQFAGETSSVRLDLRLTGTASLSGWPYLRAYRSSLWYDSASADSKLRHNPQLRSYPHQQVRVGTLPKSSCAQDVTLSLGQAPS